MKFVEEPQLHSSGFHHDLPKEMGGGIQLPDIICSMQSIGMATEISHRLCLQATVTTAPTCRDSGRIPGVEIVRSVAFDPENSRSISPIVLGQDFAAISEFRKWKIDAVFESARFFGWRAPFPCIAWIPDMQHRELPELFSTRARWRREIGFRLQILSGRTIMLSSESAEQECLSYYPSARGRTSVVKFASEPSSEQLCADPVEVVRKYDLPVGFFYLPNQFWRHKNHQIVIDALALLASRGEQVIVAASGGPDPSEPELLAKIVQQAADRGLDKAFRYLGMIPAADVYALLRCSAGLINPSRFEGWSTTVEEAKSFNVPMILSDIRVHQEQTLGTASYFDPNDAERLADNLVSLRNINWHVRPLASTVDDRVNRFASEFVRTVRHAIGARVSGRPS